VRGRLARGRLERGASSSESVSLLLSLSITMGLSARRVRTFSRSNQLVIFALPYSPRWRPSEVLSLGFEFGGRISLVLINGLPGDGSTLRRLT
jgi:hypothetical protein